MASTQTLHAVAEWATYALAVAGVLGAGWWAERRAKSARYADDKNLVAH